MMNHLGSWLDVPDAALLRAYAQGDMGAARVLTARVLPRVLAQAKRMLSDQAEAEDVSQDALMRLWKIAPDWRQDEAQITTWLYRVTANLCTDRLRKQRNVPLDELTEPADTMCSVPKQIQDKARFLALSNALAKMPERQAKAVSLRHLEGLSNPEIAKVMDISLRSVESLTARGKLALANILLGRKAELGYDDE